jgi:hypothetical protein
VKEFTVDELKAEIARLQGEYPYDHLPLPVLMSKRPIFRG